MPFPDANVISVSELNRLARDLLESGLPALWISGEISNLTLAASGHAYFSLKDERAQIRAVMFRNRLSQLGFVPKEGMRVEARGTVTLYEPRGDYQVNLAELRQAGLGALFEAFEKLKARLAIEGLFDNRHKKPLPAHPRAIGIVTSPRAAALRDVVTTLRRRAPGIPLILYPAQVQGEAAPAQIVAAIEAAGTRQEVDVLIVCRGGGSIEDLWSFNDERVARAVFACPLPVVSGVGHETDFTICDFVADLRAPTPTAAAELTSPDRAAMLARLAELRRQLDQALRRRLENAAQRLDQLGRRLVHPGARLNQQRERLAADARLLEQLIRSRLSSTRQRIDGLGERLRRASPDLPRRAERLARAAAALTRARNGLLDVQRQRLARLADQLSALNPEAVLARGYAIVETADGHAATDPARLAQNERVTLRLARGSVDARISLPPRQHELPL